MFGSTASGIDLLKRLATREASPSDLDAVAARVATYLRGAPEGVTLAEAFDLAVRPGGEPWYARERREARNAELRALVDEFSDPTAAHSVIVAWLALLVRRYATTSWPRDREASEMPAHYAGCEKAHLWRAFKLSPPPCSERHLRKILDRDANSDAEP